MEPASIRYKNPGAMWGRTGKRPSADKIVATNAPIPLKWGSTQTAYLSDGLGQGNNIAIFNNWVDGICAQLDLWRSSPNYKNKRFADAIHIWDGGNNTPSYIAYVKARVPGITENTIMNDAFWKSPSGIAFLKAQSGHEAGKAIPAPDGDWIEAQRRVFANQFPAKTAAPVVVAPTANIDPVLQEVQRELIAFGYHEIGEDDGKMGGKTRGAIEAFATDRKLAYAISYPGADAFPGSQLHAALNAAHQENWQRPIAPARAFKTEADLSSSLASLPPAKNATLIQKFTAWFTGVGSVGGAALQYMPTAHDTVAPYKAMVSDWFSDVPGWVWMAVVASVAIATVRLVNQSKSATVADYQRGKIN